MSADAKNKTYGDSNPTLTYTIGGMGLVDGDTLSGSLSTAAMPTSNVGTYPITQGNLAASSNYSATFTGADLNVAARPVAIMGDAKTKVYGSTDPTLTYQITSGNLVGTDAFSGSLSRNGGEKVGSYAISQGALSLSSNYQLTYVGKNLSITPASLVIKADDKSRAPGVQNPSFTASYSGLVRGDDQSMVSGLTLATTANTGSPEGNYPIVPSGAKASNYSISYLNGNLSVTSSLLIPVTVAADNISKVYGGADPLLSYRLISGTLNNGDGFSGSLARSSGENVGSYPITQGSLSLPPGYLLNVSGAAFTINPRPITISADPKTKIYGTGDPTLTYQITSGNLVGTDTFSGSLGRNGGESVGTYAINQGSLGLSSNYALTYTGNNLSLTQRPITVTADAKTRTYGDSNPDLTYSVGGMGLVNGDRLSGSLSTDATPAGKVGTYIINQGSLGNPDYSLTYIGSTLSVVPAPLTIKANDVSRQAATADPSFTATYTGFRDADGLDTIAGLSFSTLASLSSPVGTYPIIPSGASALNYAITYVNGLLTVTQAPTSFFPPTLQAANLIQPNWQTDKKAPPIAIQDATTGVDSPQAVNQTTPKPAINASQEISSLQTYVPSVLLGTQNQVSDNYQTLTGKSRAGETVTWGWAHPGFTATAGQTTYAPIDSMKIVVNGQTKTLNAYANVDSTGSSTPEGPFQCTALVAQYLALLGYKNTEKSLPNGQDVVTYVVTKNDPSLFNSSAKSPPEVGSIVSMKTNEPEGHVAIVKGVQDTGPNTRVITVIEDNLTFNKGATFAVNRQITFTKSADGTWSANHVINPASGRSYSVVNWATPTALP